MTSRVTQYLVHMQLALVENIFFYLQIFLWMEKKKLPLVSKYIAVGQIHVMGLVAALQLLQHYTFLVIAHSPANI